MSTASYLRRSFLPVVVATGSAVSYWTSNDDVTSSTTTKLEANNNNSIKSQQQQQQQHGSSSSSSKLLFVGTGSSTGCPKPLCAMLFPPGHDHDNENNDENDENVSSQSVVTKLRKQYQDKCHTSRIAIKGDPKNNKNYRNNPCLLISYCPPYNSTTECKNIIIDVGKTFREAGLRWFPYHTISKLDAIILTHHHMDAVGGLDDVRGFQRIHKRHNTASKKPPTMIPMPLFLSKHCLNDVSQRFPWLFPKQQPNYKTGSVDDATLAVERHVASFDITEFQSYKPFEVVPGLNIIPLPVWHGQDLISYGFAFSIPSGKKFNNKKVNIVYISDISQMIPETLDYILHKLPPTDILIIDALLIDKPHPVHYSLVQAIELSEQIQAKQTYVVGMNCDAFPTHEEMNFRLQQRRKTGLNNIQLAYDGQIINL